jgi:hypothetical protein
MSRITETLNKLGIDLIAKAPNLSRPFLVLLILLSAPGLCLAKTSDSMAALNAQQIASLLQKEGVAKEKIPTMTAIALAESSGRPQAFNPRGLDKSYGLFQVNMYGGLGPARMKEFGLQQEKELFDPSVNVRAAKKILGSQGLGAWSVYKSGQYKQFLPEAQKATQTLGTGQPQEQSQQKPQEVATAPGGRVFIVPMGEEGTEEGKDYLDKFLQNRLPIDTGIDPVALLTQAFKAPNYLEG